MSVVKCVECGNEFNVCSPVNHYKKFHSNLTDIELSKLHYLNNPKMGDFGLEFIDYLFEHKVVLTFQESYQYITKKATSFVSFKNLIRQYREFSVKDVETYFQFYLPFKEKHPKAVNSVELCVAICRNDVEEGRKFYENIIKPKNAYTGHGGELSPWSKDFVGYKDLSEEDKNKARRQKCFCKDREDFDELEKNCTTSVQYYINQGMSEEDAKKALKDRQRTFSLEKCIEKYGEEEGIKRFKERQKKWLNSLNTPENIEKLKNGRINGLKKQYGKHYSNISQKLFNEITNKLNNDNLEIFFATNKNGEYNVNISPLKAPMLDFYIPELNKWIEFDGDYWHGEKRGNQERDKKRETAIFENVPGIQLKRVKERDYKKDPEKIVNECVEWILEEK